MPDYSRNRTSLKTVIAEIRAAIATGLGSTVNVAEHAYTDWSDVFYFLATITPPAAVIVYNGSQYGDDTNRTMNISVGLFTLDYANNPNASDEVQDLVETVITAVDHQLYQTETILVRAVSDKPIKMSKNAGPVGHEIVFKIEVY